MNDHRWIVVTAYAAAAVLAFAASRNSERRERTFWSGTGIVLFLLGLAKEFRLQDDLTDAVRGALKSAGWYGWHEQAQMLVGALIVILIAAAGLLLARWLAHAASPVKAAAALLTLFAAFLLVRAASFHAVDPWVMRTAWGLRLGWWIELLFLAMTVALALTDIGQRKHSL